MVLRVRPQGGELGARELRRARVCLAEGVAPGGVVALEGVFEAVEDVFGEKGGPGCGGEGGVRGLEEERGEVGGGWVVVGAGDGGVQEDG